MREDAYPGIHSFSVEEITSFSLRRKNDGIRKTVLPEYSPSRLITYSVFKVTGQVNTISMIFHLRTRRHTRCSFGAADSSGCITTKKVCLNKADILPVLTPDSCSTLLGSLNLTTQAGFLTYRSSLDSPSHTLRTYNGILNLAP